MHVCPVDGCELRVGDHLLMCRSHWRKVSASIQRDVYAAYRARGQSAEHARHHLKMCAEAVAAVNSALKGTT